MPTLEVRRHSIRKTGGGSQLSQDGVDLARQLGESSGPYAIVTTSVVPRARETALAMGFAVDHEIVTLAADEGVYSASEDSKWWLSDQPFVALANLIDTDPAYGNYANSMAAIWRDLLTPLGADDAVLVIGHSGELESALVACLPDAAYAEWGKPFGPCEGARLTYDVRFRSVELLRVP